MPFLMKKILVLAHHVKLQATPNGYRIGQYFPYYREKGFEVLHVTSRTAFPALIQGLRQADVVYVQRLLPDPLKRYLLRSFAKRVVFDFDDAIMYGIRGKSRKRRIRFRRMVELSNAVFCGNNFLLSEAKRYKTENVSYVPTVVDTADYPIKEHLPAQPFELGWIGTTSTSRYLHDIAPVLTKEVQSGVAFKVVADKAPDLRFTCLFEKWSGDREKQMLLGFDAGVMPARDDIWSRGKCGLKLIQYFATGLPAISHPYGVSSEIIEDGENGFLRKDEEGWREAIELLRGDLDLRRTMGSKARKTAEERYCLRVWGPRVADIIDGL
jgi:glycosyltransferase involved in cell wall biosynthesis